MYQSDWKWLFIYIMLQISAVRINVYAENSSKSDMYPLLFMVKEQRSILSWQVPLILSHR